MARLTDELSPSSGSSPIIPSQPSNTSIGSALSHIASGINSFAATATQNAALKRQARQDALKTEQDATSNDTIIGLNAAYHAPAPEAAPAAPPVVSSDPMEQRASNFKVDGVAMDGLKQINIAANQGRVPRIAADAAVDRVFQEQLSRHPHNAPDIVDAMEKAGVKSAWLQSWRDQQKVHDTNLDNDLKLGGTAYEKGVGELGAVALSMPREEVMAYGFKRMQSDATFELTKRNSDLQASQIKNSQEQKTYTDKQNDDNLSNNIEVTMNNRLQAFLESTRKARAIYDTLEPGKANIEWAQFGQKFDSAAALTINQAIAEAGSNGMSQDSQATLRKNLEEKYKAGKTMFGDDYAKSKQYTDAYDNIQKNIGIDGSTAFPLFQLMKQTGVQPGQMVLMLGGLDKGVRDAVSREAQGFANYADPNTGMKHVHNAFDLITGVKTLHDLDPESQAKQVPVMYNISKGEAAKMGIAGNSPEAFLHATGALALAGSTISAANGENTNIVALMGVASAHHVGAYKKLMADPNTHDEAAPYVQGVRASAANIMDNINKLAPTVKDGYWGVQFDRGSGQYKAVFDDKGFRSTLRNINAPGVMSAIDPYATESPDHRLGAKPALPPRLSRFVGAANQGLYFLSETEKYSEHPVKGTPLEVRRLYAVNEPTDAMIKEKVNTNRSIQVDFEKSIQTLEQGLDKEVSGTGPVAKPIPQDSPYVPIVTSAAQKHGIPVDVALHLVNQESTFNPGADSHYAYGLGQISYKTKSGGPGTAQTQYGLSKEALFKMSPEEQADLSMGHLAKLYAQYKNWPDALSAYHSGKPLAAAAKAHSQDAGGKYTTDYVKEIIGNLG